MRRVANSIKPALMTCSYVRALLIMLLSFGTIGLGLTQSAYAESFKFNAEHVLGTNLRVVIESNNKQQANEIYKSIVSEITRQEKILSTWKIDSEISKMNALSEFQLSPILGSVIELCQSYKHELAGAFDCQAGSVIAMWRTAAKTGILPSTEKLEAEVKHLKSDDVFYDAQTHTLRKPAHKTFNVDGVAKGWIIDKSVEVAKENASSLGLTQAFGVLVEIGGDIRLYGNLPQPSRRIGVSVIRGTDNSLPQEILQLRNGAIATSGQSARDLVVGNRSFSHIISPLTAQPQDKTNQVSVVAPTAAQADALATAFSVMGVSQSLLYANTHAGVETLIITNGGTRFTSKGWKALVAPMIKKTAASVGVDNPLPEDFGLYIDYEIPRIDTSDYEYPYVVMWVTTEDKKLVRALTVIGNQPRWVEENYVFWRRYGRKNLALIEALSRPSKAPGQYNLSWDGYSHKGEPVAQGTYILHIEASREHGGHQYIKRELSLSSDTFEDIVNAGDELGQIDIHYGVKPE